MKDFERDFVLYLVIFIIINTQLLTADNPKMPLYLLKSSRVKSEWSWRKARPFLLKSQSCNIFKMPCSILDDVEKD